MRILTFNWHEAYLCALAKTGHAFDIVERHKGGSRAWFYETRPLPSNARIVREGTARAGMRGGAYDLVICHNPQDLMWTGLFDVPRVLVLHNRLSTELALGGNTVDRDAHRAEVVRLIAGAPTRVVCISETKRADWDLDAVVIPPGIDLDDYSGYEGSLARVLRVGNFMKARDLMLGYRDQLAILDGRPSTLLGLNDPEDGAEVRFSRSWDDLKACFRSHRVFLNTTVEGFEDGYNLSMLEAMATGMPVVSTANATSPLTDGVDGFVSDDRAYLARRLADLLEDEALARRLGARARETVAATFAMSDFVERWNRVLDDARRAPGAARRAVQVTSVSAAAPTGGTLPAPRAAARRRIALSYVSYPATTARYLEASLRRAHDVVTIGPAMGEGLRQAWNLQNMREAIRPHDVPTEMESDIRPLLDRLGACWTPDLFLWVESVYGHFPAGVSRLGVPSACYLIDSHMNLPWHLDWARQFDHVFVAQREYIPSFLEAGIPRVHWLPLACDPDIHGPVAGPKRYDVGFVGSLTPHHARRQRLLERLGRVYHVHIERAFLRDMAAVLSASRIVFNDAVRRDLNMRVFEALCTGSFLLTDRAAPSGLDELFVDREHLAIYEDETLDDLVAYYLAHEDEREAIAARGRAEVLARHTYDHRVAAILEAVGAPDSEPCMQTVAGRWVQDPLIREADDHLGRGAFDAALDRLRFLHGARELSRWEWFTARQIEAAALGALGRLPESRAAHAAALAELSAGEREALRAAAL
ncbi:MAG: glycosyltransferase [Acidobacteriota bacterium]